MANPIVGKNIVLGVTGSIAAYKAADIASKLSQQGAQVTAILTQPALEFVSPLTFQSVTGVKAYVDEDLWGGEGHVVHVQIGHTTDLLVVAPACKYNGQTGQWFGQFDRHRPRCSLPHFDRARDGRGHVWPSGHAEEYRNPQIRGVYFIGPDEGHLASDWLVPAHE